MSINDNVLVIGGSRPEYIKLFPIVLELRARGIDTTFLMTGQHTDLVYSTIDAVGVYPDIEFDAISHSTGEANVSLPYMLEKINETVKEINPSFIIVQGDTTSTLAGALSALTFDVPLVHVEAGIRTYSKEPYPEESNRQMVSRIASIHCCPTEWAMYNLLSEQVGGYKCITGNTEIDALYYALDNLVPKKSYHVDNGLRTIVVTLHRRESIGVPMRNVCRDIVAIAEKTPVDIIVTKHPNPRVAEIIEDELGSVDLMLNSSIMVVDPMDFVSFVHQLNKSTLVITDSGGVQESASALAVPVVVARDETDRPECAEAAFVAGTSSGDVFNATMNILKSQDIYNMMCDVPCPFGDGKAAQKIVDILWE